MKKIITEITAILLCLILTFSVCNRIAFVLMPERYDYGGTWNMFLKEPKNSIDLLVVGSSHAYCNVIPANIKEQTGINSYVLAAPCLTMPLGYYYLKEALKTQKPQAIMLELTGMFFTDTMGFAKQSIGYMPYNVNRLMSTLVCAEDNEKLGLLFPLYNYHERWQEFKVTDFFKERPDQKTDINAGYTPLLESEQQQNRTEREFEYTDKSIKLNQKYLKKIIALCKDEGIELSLFIAPTCLYIGNNDKKLITDCTRDTPFYDFNDEFESFGFDLKKDFYDSKHLNFYGAKKFTPAFCDYVTKSFNITSKDSDLWNDRITSYKNYGN